MSRSETSRINGAKSTGPKTEDARLFTAIQSLTDNSRFSSHLSRYESRVHRMYHRAMDTLQALKNKKCGFEPEENEGS